MRKTINFVIVTYNNRELLRKCIESVFLSLGKVSLRDSITVVDNNSADGTCEMVRRDFPSVHCIANKVNSGTARAFNQGIRAGLESDLTMILNDDVELFSDTIAGLIETLERFPEAQGVPAALVNPDGTRQPVKLRIFGTTRDYGNEIRYPRFSGTTACLYETEVFRRFGLFDEFYFFYNEDLDFSIRMRRNGVRFVFNPEAKVIHYGCQGRKKGERFVRPHFYAADYYFYRKNYGPIFSSVYLMMAFVHIVLQKRRLKREGEDENLRLLLEGRQKLLETVRKIKRLVRGKE